MLLDKLKTFESLSLTLGCDVYKETEDNNKNTNAFMLVFFNKQQEQIGDVTIYMDNGVVSNLSIAFKKDIEFKTTKPSWNGLTLRPYVKKALDRKIKVAAQ